MKTGISPRTVAAQVASTAPWLAAIPAAAPVTRALAGEGGTPAAYLHILLAAHFATVATFVPTDVDARIRHHAWVAVDDPQALLEHVEVVDEVASWDPRWVSERVLSSERGALSGHDGEWMAVRAGALGRAATLGATAIAERLAAEIDRELDREAQIMEDAAEAPARKVLAIATTIAHNLGDLSRVVEAWPRHEALEPLRPRYARLGHGGSRRAFALAGALNKALMAHENHRFLPLRKVRALRRARSLLLPIGPWFDAWGEATARSPELEDGDRAELVAALLEIHLRAPDQLGCLRALAGIHRATRGGLEAHVPSLPARLRKEALRGRVREALDIGADHFDARVAKKLQLERERPLSPS